MGRPSSPARWALPGEPPTPAPPGRACWDALGEIGASSSRGRNRPDQVTWSSAGGWSVCGHLVAPGSRGLFHQAMIQSGSCYTHTQQQTDTAGTATATAVGCTDPATVVACLRATPVGRLLDVTPQNLVLLPFALVRGTPTLPRDPAQAVASGGFARVPVVNGPNRDEGRTPSQVHIGATRKEYVAWVRDNFGANADAVLARYPWPANADQFTAASPIAA